MRQASIREYISHWSDKMKFIKIWKLALFSDAQIKHDIKYSFVFEFNRIQDFIYIFRRYILEASFYVIKLYFIN
jgi:hypothetical protein